ncbi:RDD family protein [Flavobacterium sp.]|uniref:RDD family protein n=1 Tax=Flavobacterium sp. TaxID=239 RepID=UPI002631A43B|nr:RDD family protein [Flavobacterium sp.]
MITNFDHIMSNKSDGELIRIVTVDVHKYQKEAVASAQKEIEKRDIDSAKFETIATKALIEKRIENKLNQSEVSTASRIVNFIVDLVSFWIIFFVIAMLINIIFTIDLNNDLLIWGILLLAFFMYYIIMEFKFQKTIGKFITKTKVVNLYGKKPSLNDIIIRTCCRLIPFDRVSFLFTKNGFHDKISNTTVIKD